MRIYKPAALAGFALVLSALAHTAMTSNPPQLARVPGKVHRLAQPRYDIGEAPSSLDMGGLSIIFTKTPAQQAALKQLINAQQDPKSPQYHRFVTPAQYGAQFGASDATI